MAGKKLSTILPHPVEASLKNLGANLRTARLRRNLTLKNIADKIGVDRRTVSEAEKGNPSTTIAVYASILWVLDLLNQFDELALPEKDAVGQTLALAREPLRARVKKDMDNDF